MHYIISKFCIQYYLSSGIEYYKMDGTCTVFEAHQIYNICACMPFWENVVLLE